MMNRKNMLFSIVIVLIVTIIILAENSNKSAQNIDEKRFTLTQVQDDFEEIKITMEQLHPKLYTDSKELEALFASQYDQLKEGMTAIDFYRVVAPIISASRCGHTYIGLSDQDFTPFIESARLLPFNIYWQNNIALVYANVLIPQLPIGSQVLSIDGIKMEEVITGLLQNLSSDGENQTQKIRSINDGFRYHYAMDRPTPEKVNIEFIDPDSGVKSSLEIETVYKSELEAAGDSIWGHMSWLSRENSSLFEKDYALLRMASFYPSGSNSVKSFKTLIDVFFAKVKQDQIQNVVIDVRDNSGGDPNVAAHLLSYIEKVEVPYFEVESGSYYPNLMEPVPFAENRYTGNLYVLINGRGFSTTGHFLALLKYHNIGIMIGEETGGSFACTDASVIVNLTNTNLKFKSSRRIFKVAVEGLIPGRGVFPDYTVVPTLEEIMSKTDIEMAMALELIKNHR